MRTKIHKFQRFSAYYLYIFYEKFLTFVIIWLLSQEYLRLVIDDDDDDDDDNNNNNNTFLKESCILV